MTYNTYQGKNSPTLSVFEGDGIYLRFQDGPIKEHGVNGTTNEEIIELLIERLESLDFHLPSPFNQTAIGSLYIAKAALGFRTLDRIDRDVEGTSQA